MQLVQAGATGRFHLSIFYRRGILCSPQTVDQLLGLAVRSKYPSIKFGNGDLPCGAMRPVREAKHSTASSTDGN